ncbi:right-handed parallel beta-helix repeat-containing protein [bacterium]|nr:right-handed parallel beta-helix repeat-containing protein [bacterium]
MLALFVIAGNSWAADRYVDPAGTCGGNLPCYTTIQAAVNASAAFDVIYIGAGTYNEIVNVTTNDLTIIGAGEGVVTIDASGLSSPNNAGFHITGANVSVSGFTLTNDAIADPTYGLKFSNTTNGTAQNITVTNFWRTGIDIPSVTGLVLNNVTSHDNFGGGIALRDVSNATISNVTTNNNPWGGLRLQSYYGTFSGVVVSGTNTFGELGLGGGGIYIEEGNVLPAGPPYPISYGHTGTPDVLLQAADAMYALYGNDDQAPQYQRIYLFPSLAQAVAAANVANYGHLTTNKYIKKIDDGSFWVGPGMLIQAAINAASSGDEINVLAGTYAEYGLNINVPLTIAGAGIGSTIIDPPAGNIPVFRIYASDVTIRDMKITTAYRCVYTDASGISNLELINLDFDLFTDRGLEMQHTGAASLLTDLLIDGCVFTPATSNKTCIRGSSARQVDGFELRNSTFNACELGIYNANDSGSSWFKNVYIHNNTFNSANFAAVYFEEIENCLVENNLFNTCTRGLFIYKAFTNSLAGVSNITVRHNDFVGSPDRALALALYNHPVNGIDVYENYINGGQRFIYFDTDATVTGLNTIHVNRNSISGLSGNEFHTSAYDAGENWVLDFSNNYWGTSDATQVTVGSVGAPPVPLSSFDYTPMISNGADQDGGARGFIPELSNLIVHAEGGQTGSLNRIQEALGLVSGSTINLLAGTYVGQVHAQNFTNLNIIGAGVGSTFIKAPATAMPSSYPTPGYSNYPVLFLDNSTVQVSGLTVDGDGKGNVNYRMNGIAFWNSGGSLTNVDVVAVRDTPFSGSQHGVGVVVNHNTTGKTVYMTNVNITDFQKNGTAFSGAGTNVICDNVHIYGAGPTGVTAQNGFQYGSNTTGSLANSSVNGVCYTGPSWVATSILSFGDLDLVNTGTSNAQLGLYGIDANITMDGGSFISSNAVTAYAKFGLYFYSTGAALSVPRVQPQAYSDETETRGFAGSRNLDDDESITIDGVAVIGDGSAGGVGVAAYVDGGNVDVSLTNSTVSNWDYGVDWTVAGGTIDNATVTGNTLSNNVNTFDNTSGHTWDSNCYSDYSSNDGYPGTYVIGGDSGNVDNNPNPNGCSEINLLVSDDFVGCNTGCNTVDLYVTLGTAGIPNLELVIELPAGFTAGPLGSVFPPSNEDANLISAYAMAVNDCVIVNMAFEGPGFSTGDYTKYVAVIPLTVTAPTGVYAITSVSSLWIDNLGGNHVNALDLGDIAIEVDCTPPVISNFANSVACAFGNASQLIDAFSATFTDNAADLDTAWVTFAPGGGSFGLFGPTQSSGYAPTFPSAGDAATFYGLLVEGCNTLTLHLVDTECNVALTVDLENVGRDNTAPDLTVTPAALGCYGVNTYLGLDDDLDITYLANATACGAALQSLKIWLNGGTDTLLVSVPFANADWPFDDAEATTLWNWIVGSSGVPNTADGETYTFGLQLCDCAGNCDAGSFTMCIDLTAPGNTLTYFDARPAHLGVWLAWSWAAGPNAQEMRIYRSPLSGEYPAYPNDLWNNLANYDVTSVPPSGWTLVATQTAVSGTITSATYGTNNNRGDLYTHIDGSTTYWLDAQGGWVDGDTNSATYRDIYRYVTFVKDAGGNWSLNSPVAMLQNADRSTNYWLGDFSTADDPGPVNSRGRVDNDDLAILSPVYFTNAGGYRNIGPVWLPAENGTVGKSIPDPDGAGAINFQDLVPFGFNYGAVSPVGGLKEFSIQPDPLQYRPFNSLDEAPVVALEMPLDATMEVGSEFTVTVAMYGNEANAVKGVEAILSYDDVALEVVTSTTGTAAAPEGTLFAKSAVIGGVKGQVGFVAASCGGWSTLEGNAILGTVTFRVTRALTANSELALTSVSMFDNTGEIIEVEGGTVPLFSTPSLPDNYALYQNYPNPFNPTTNLRFDLRDAGHVKIMVYNTLGQVVATAVDRELEAGRHTVTFDASSLSTGVYMYTISVNGFTDVKKMVLIR